MSADWLTLSTRQPADNPIDMNQPHILCVTLNPCLDKTLTVPPWQPGDNVRGTSVREVVGGKGNNVARALKRLGHTARPCTFLGGSTGHRCETLLNRDDGLDGIFIPTKAETRTILTVRTGDTAEQSAFFDPDPAISTAEAAQLHFMIDQELKSGHVQALTLSGSSPSAATHSAYADLVLLARQNAIPVLLDTYGAALKHLGLASPDILQLNRKEVAGQLGISQDSISSDDIFLWLQARIQSGTRLAVVTQGPDSVLAATAEGLWQATPPAIQPVNPIGSGDCFLAGLTTATLSHKSTEETLKYAVACAVANALVWDAGAISADSVHAITTHVRVARLS